MKLQLKKGKTTKILPIAVWLSAVCAVGYLLNHQAHRTQLVGIAYSELQTINSVESGYIRSMPVTLYQEVKKGDTLAIIKECSLGREEYNDEYLKARQATEQAELERLKAELAAVEQELINEQFTLENEIISEGRSLSIEVEKARLSLLQIRASLEPGRLTLKDMEVEIEIVESLLAQGAAEQYELDKCRSEYNILKEQIAIEELQLAAAELTLKNAQLQREEFEAQKSRINFSIETRLEPIRKAIVVQERVINEIMNMYDTVVLKAPFDGIVNNLYFKSGQAVTGGAIIMTLIKPQAQRIMAWVPQKSIGHFTPGTKVEIVSLTDNRISFESEIANVSAAMELMPDVLWPSPTIPTWGRPIEIPILPEFKSIHNEMVGLRVVRSN